MSFSIKFSFDPKGSRNKTIETPTGYESGVQKLHNGLFRGVNSGHSTNECIEENRGALGVGERFEAGEDKLTCGEQKRDALVWTAVAEIDP